MDYVKKRILHNQIICYGLILMIIAALASTIVFGVREKAERAPHVQAMMEKMIATEGQIQTLQQIMQKEGAKFKPMTVSAREAEALKNILAKRQKYLEELRQTTLENRKK